MFPWRDIRKQSLRCTWKYIFQLTPGFLINYQRLPNCLKALKEIFLIILVFRYAIYKDPFDLSNWPLNRKSWFWQWVFSFLHGFSCLMYFVCVRNCWCPTPTRTWWHSGAASRTSCWSWVTASAQTPAKTNPQRNICLPWRLPRWGRTVCAWTW